MTAPVHCYSILGESGVQSRLDNVKDAVKEGLETAHRVSLSCEIWSAIVRNVLISVAELVAVVW